MQKIKKKLVIISLIIIGIFILYQYRTYISFAYHGALPPDTSDIDISEWNEYINEELGISFKYPKEWAIDEDDDGIIFYYPRQNEDINSPFWSPSMVHGIVILKYDNKDIYYLKNLSQYFTLKKCFNDFTEYIAHNPFTEYDKDKCLILKNSEKQKYAYQIGVSYEDYSHWRKYYNSFNELIKYYIFFDNGKMVIFYIFDKTGNEIYIYKIPQTFKFID